MSSQGVQSTTQGSHPFSGRSRCVAAVLLMTGTILQVVEFVLEDPTDD